MCEDLSNILSFWEARSIMKLTPILSGQDAETLLAIASHWEISVSAVGVSESAGERCTALVAELEPRMVSEHYFHGAFERLEAHDRTLLYFMVAHGGVLSVDELSARGVHAPGEDTAGWLGRMLCAGMVFPCEVLSDCFMVPRCHFQHLDLPVHFSSFLGGLLNGLTVSELQVLAETVLPDLFDVEELEVVVYRLRQQLLSPEFLRCKISNLHSGADVLFGELLHNGSMAIYRDLLEVTAANSFDTHRAEQLQMLVQTSGVAFAVKRGANRFSNLVVIPQDVVYMISNNYAPDGRSAQELDNVYAQSAAGQTLSDVSGNAQMLLRDLTMLSAWHERGDGVAFNALLCGSKPDCYVQFLREYLVKRKFLTERNGFANISLAFAKLLVAPQKLYLDLLNWWVTTRRWNEADVGKEAQTLNGEICVIRCEVLRSLRKMSAGQWVRVQDFVAPLLPFLEAEFSSHQTFMAPAKIREATIRILTQTLQWLGITATAVTNSQDGSASSHTVIQVTPVGDCMLAKLCADGSTFANDALDGHVFFAHRAAWAVFQGNMQIIAPPDLALQHLWKLCRFTDITSVDVMSSLVVTQASVLRASESGMLAGAIAEFCQEIAQSPVPQPITALLQQLKQKHSNNELRLLSPAAHLVSDMPHVIAEVAASPQIRTMVASKIGTKHLLFQPQYSVERIAKELRSAGYVSVVTDNAAAVAGVDSGTYQLTLNQDELTKMLAILRMLSSLSREFKTDVTGGQADAMDEKIVKAIPFAEPILEQARTLANQYEERVRGAVDQRVNERLADLRTKLERLAQRTMGSKAQPKRALYEGANPATGTQDIAQLLQFAIAHDRAVDILYIRKNRTESELTVHPKTLDANRLMAFCDDTDLDTLYSLDRILRAKITEHGNG